MQLIMCVHWIIILFVVALRIMWLIVGIICFCRDVSNCDTGSALTKKWRTVNDISLIRSMVFSTMLLTSVLWS